MVHHLEVVSPTLSQRNGSAGSDPAAKPASDTRSLVAAATQIYAGPLNGAPSGSIAPDVETAQRPPDTQQQPQTGAQRPGSYASAAAMGQRNSMLYQAPITSNPLVVHVLMPPGSSRPNLAAMLSNEHSRHVESAFIARAPTVSSSGLIELYCYSEDGAATVTQVLGRALGESRVKHLAVLTIQVTIEGMPGGQSDADLITALQPYGQIMGPFTRSIVCGLPGRSRRVPMTLTNPIPRTLKVGSTECRITYAGQPPTCKKCGKFHAYVDCHLVSCFRCGLHGHLVTDCKRPCNFCGRTGHFQSRCPLRHATGGNVAGSASSSMPLVPAQTDNNRPTSAERPAQQQGRRKEVPPPTDDSSDRQTSLLTQRQTSTVTGSPTSTAPTATLRSSQLDNLLIPPSQPVVDDTLQQRLAASDRRRREEHSALITTDPSAPVAERIDRDTTIERRPEAHQKAQSPPKSPARPVLPTNGHV